MREGEHLETAAVGDDGGVAADEAVEAAGIGDALGAGLEHEVVGIGEHQVETGFREGLVGDSLERAVRADRHEPRGLDDAVGGVDAPYASGGALGLVHELEAEEIARHVGRELARGGRGLQGIDIARLTPVSRARLDDHATGSHRRTRAAEEIALQPRERVAHVPTEGDASTGV